MAKKSTKQLWPDEEEWLDLFREIFCNNPVLAETFARIWYALIEHVGQGPAGARDARRILNQALRLTYPFTSSHRLAYRHYMLSLSGYILPEDEPGHLLRESIKRARAQIAKAKGPEPE